MSDDPLASLTPEQRLRWDALSRAAAGRELPRLSEHDKRWAVDKHLGKAGFEIYRDQVLEGMTPEEREEAEARIAASQAMSYEERRDSGDYSVSRTETPPGYLDTRTGIFHPDAPFEPMDRAEQVIGAKWFNFRNIRWSHFLQFDGVLVKTYIQSLAQGKGLYVWGNTGSGKTAFNVCIYRDLYYRHGGDVVFEKYQDMLDKFRDFDNGAAEFFELCRSTKVLMIDDIGQGNSTAYAQQQIERILDSRMDAEKLTYATGNLNLEDLRAVLNAMHQLGKTNLPVLDGDRLYSRGHQLFKTVHLAGPDRREHPEVIQWTRSMYA